MAETNQVNVSDGGSVSIVYGMTHASGWLLLGNWISIIPVG
jgi:hypothetical protein